MKRIVGFVCAFVVSVSLLAAADFTAEVVSISGKAEVLDGTSWRALSSGDTLKSGDTVQTGFRSSLVLKIKDSTINVAALTRMTVEQLSENSDRDDVRVFVNAGSVASSANATSGKRLGFTVRTPVATASVRGTEFSVENTFNSTNVQTTRGAVAVWSGENSVSVAGRADEGSDGAGVEAAETIEASFENAPRGAVMVTQNQSAQLAMGGSVTAPSEVAASAAVDIGSGLQTPAGEGGQRQNAGTDANAATATITVTVQFSDAN